jgi:hypothetical protein
MTDFDQSALDPTGGHGLTIAVDSSIAQPFRWYFRDYPSLQVIADAASISPAPQVVISNGVVRAAPNRTARSFAYQTTLASSLAQPHWSSLIVSILDPNQIRAYLGYLIDHRVAVPPAPRQFTVSLSGDVAQRIFGVTP